MVRPQASENCKALATLFAKAITVEVRGVAPASSSVGRSGPHSIFDALTECFPHASRDRVRSGVSLVELNKALEKEGFQRVRFRNLKKRGCERADQPGGRKWRDPDNQSFYRYGSRRWRDPEDPADFEYLSAVWPQVNELSPVKCGLGDIMQYLREAIAADMDSEVIKRKMVGLSSTTASQATTPTCGTPMSMMSPFEGDESFEGESEGDQKEAASSSDCWDALEVFGQEEAAPAKAVASGFDWTHEMFPTADNMFFEGPMERCSSAPDLDIFVLGLNEPEADLSADGLMNVFSSDAPIVSCAGW